MKRIIKRTARNLIANLLYPLTRSIQRKRFKILTYHRITENNDYLIEDGMYVRPDTFEKHLNFFSNYYNVITIDKLVENISNDQSIPSNTLALTFDDGWKDNYDYAFPLLKKHNTPATIFLATSYINTDRSFWTDRILTTYHLDKSNLKDILDKYEIIDKGIDYILNQIKSFKFHLRENLIRDLEKLSIHKLQPKRLFLNWDEIKEMDDSSLITFGSHSHSHEQLSDMQSDFIHDDVTISLNLLNKNCKHKSRGFCYPGGYYNKSTQTVIDSLGFNFSLITDNSNLLENSNNIFRRINIHEDIASTRQLLNYRLHY